MPKKLLFKKVAIMDGKGEFSKTVFATFPQKLQIYVTLYTCYKGRQFQAG